MTTVTKSDIQIRDMGPDVPAHYASFGWGADSWERYQAGWTMQAEDRLRPRGCPIGTGKTVLGAMRDLVSRTNAENRLNLKLEEV